MKFILRWTSGFHDLVRSKRPEAMSVTGIASVTSPQAPWTPANLLQPGAAFGKLPQPAAYILKRLEQPGTMGSVLGQL